MRRARFAQVGRDGSPRRPKNQAKYGLRLGNASYPVDLGICRFATLLPLLILVSSSAHLSRAFPAAVEFRPAAFRFSN